MTSADVKFADDGETFDFQCPMYNRRCGPLLIAGAGHGIPRNGQNQNGGVAQWDWDGNKDAPTFHPSINCGTKRHPCWHGYIEKGRCVDTHHRDEPKRY